MKQNNSILRSEKPDSSIITGIVPFFPLKPNINTKADLKLEGTEEIFYNKIKKALE